MERGWGPQGERNTIHHKEFVTALSLRPGLEYGREKPLRDVRGGPGNIHKRPSSASLRTTKDLTIIRPGKKEPLPSVKGLNLCLNT